MKEEKLKPVTSAQRIAKFGYVLGVVLARAGSKGLPGKAMRELLGKPLIEYTFEHLKSAKNISNKVVSSDDEAVLEFAKLKGIYSIRRPSELASDTASTDAALRHAVRQLEQSTTFVPDIVVMLYGNVPIRANNMIDRCIEMLTQTDCDSVQTIAPVGKFHPYWMFDLNPQNQIQKHIPNNIFRRQDLPPLYSPTGAVYVMKTSVLLAAENNPQDPHAFLGTDRRALVVSPEDSVDIDTEKDLYIAEAMLRAAP